MADQQWQDPGYYQEQYYDESQQQQQQQQGYYDEAGQWHYYDYSEAAFDSAAVEQTGLAGRGLMSVE